MSRMTLEQLLAQENINYGTEFDSLYELVNTRQFSEPSSFWDEAIRCFLWFPFRGTAISFDDFLERHRLSENDMPKGSVSMNTLLTYCELVYTIARALRGVSQRIIVSKELIKVVEEQVERLVDRLSHRIVERENGMWICVEADEAAIEVAMIVSDELSSSVLGYHHRYMKGNLQGKKQVLLQLADMLEPRQQDLKSFNKSLESDLFYGLNNLNIRHNNRSTESAKHNPALDAMVDAELEYWYGATYQACLEALLALERFGRQDKLNALKSKS